MKIRQWTLAIFLVLSAALPIQPAYSTDESTLITIGSKTFTESVIIGEILRHLAQQAGFNSEHRRQLGGTRVLWNALLDGEID